MFSSVFSVSSVVKPFPRHNPFHQNISRQINKLTFLAPKSLHSPCYHWIRNKIMPDSQQQPLTKSKFEHFVLQIACVLMSEPETLQNNLDRLRDLYRPANIQEEYWLNQIAACQMRVERLDRLESGLFTKMIDDATDIGGLNAAQAFPPEMQEQTELDARQRLDYILANGFQTAVANQDTLTVYYKFRVQTERQLRRAQEQFDSIRKQHLVPPPPPSVPAQPESEAGPKREVQPQPSRISASNSTHRPEAAAPQPAPTPRRPASPRPGGSSPARPRPSVKGQPLVRPGPVM